MEKLTPDQVAVMPAGPELNEAIHLMIFKAIPLTDNEFALLRVTWETFMPSWTNQKRPFKVPMTKRELESRSYQLQYAHAADSEIFATYRLGWPQDYSGDERAAASIVWHMRGNGWLFEIRDIDEGKLRNVKFRRAVWKDSEYAGEIGGQAYGGTDALAISRAAVVAAMELEAAISRGCNIETPQSYRLATEDDAK